MFNIIKSEYDGFCNGVTRSISLLDKALQFEEGVFLSAPIVHNEEVMKKYKNLNGDKTVVISAHGISLKKEEYYKKNNIKIIDTTCPIVKKRQEDIAKQSKDNKVFLLVKTKKHDEVKALSDEGCNNNIVMYTLDDVQSGLFLKEYEKYKTTYGNYPIVHTQTTFPVSVLPEGINLSSTICPECKKRQESANKLSEICDLVIVLGSISSSNANELCNIVKNVGKTSLLIDNPEKINFDFSNVKNVGVISSSSSSNDVFERTVQLLDKINN